MYASIFENKAFSIRLGIGMSFGSLKTEKFLQEHQLGLMLTLVSARCLITCVKRSLSKLMLKKTQCKPKVSLTQLGEASSVEGWKIGGSAYSELGEAPEAVRICCYYGSGTAFLWGSKSSL